MARSAGHERFTRRSGAGAGRRGADGVRRGAAWESGRSFTVGGAIRVLAIGGLVCETTRQKQMPDPSFHDHAAI